MPKTVTRGPTERELSILQVLWEQGSSTVREVHQALQADLGLAYNTVLTMLQVMTEKRLVIRDETRYPQHYTASQTQEVTQGAMTRDFIDRVFGGSALQLVQRALTVTPASEDELARLEAFIRTQTEESHDS